MKAKASEIDATQVKTVDDIENKLNELDNAEGIENFVVSNSNDDILAPEAPVEDKAEPDKVIIPDEEIPATVETEKEKEPVTPEQPPTETEDKVKTDKVILITDELISNMNLGDKEKKYAEKFKGQPLEALMKSFANAQMLIGKKKEELFSKAEIPKTDIKVPEVQKPEEVMKPKDDLIYNELVKDFPELPKDPNLREKWLADLNYDKPRLAQKYLRKEEDVSKEIDTIWQKTEYLRENSGKINQEKFKVGADLIQDYASKNLNLDLKGLGYDLTIDKDGNNDILERLLSAEDNPDNFDPNVVSSWNGVKIINENALRNKFYEKELPSIIRKIQEGARKQGVEAKTTKTVIPSLTTQASKGKGNAKEVTADQIKQLNDISKIDELLDQEDAQYFSR